MPRLNLTEEEARHIEQRRDAQKKFDLGYNQAVQDTVTLIDACPYEAVIKEPLIETIRKLKRTIS